jgi:hypothetical protein
MSSGSSSERRGAPRSPQQTWRRIPAETRPQSAHGSPRRPHPDSPSASSLAASSRTGHAATRNRVRDGRRLAAPASPRAMYRPRVGVCYPHRNIREPIYLVNTRLRTAMRACCAITPKLCCGRFNESERSEPSAVPPTTAAHRYAAATRRFLGAGRPAASGFNGLICAIWRAAEECVA